MIYHMDIYVYVYVVYSIYTIREQRQPEREKGPVRKQKKANKPVKGR